MPGLVTTLRTNLRLGRRDLAVFELGRVFLRGAERPVEQRRLGILLSGQWHPRHWSAPSRPFDVFDLKGIVELLFERLGQAAPAWDLQAEPPAFLHPGRAARLTEGGQTLGYGGALHPDVRERLELKDEAIVLELDLERLLESAPETARFRVLDRYPAVERDLSILCDEATPAAVIDARVRQAAGERLRSVSLVDRYTGNQVPPGKVEPDGEPALPGPRANAHERRGAAGDGRRDPGAPRRGARDPGRVREASVEEGFKLLEDRIQRAAERLKELTAETKSLRTEASRANERAERAERELAALKERASSSSADAEKLEALAGEVKSLRAEREELRARVEKLAGLLDRL